MYSAAQRTPSRSSSGRRSRSESFPSKWALRAAWRSWPASVNSLGVPTKQGHSARAGNEDGRDISGGDVFEECGWVFKDGASASRREIEQAAHGFDPTLRF